MQKRQDNGQYDYAFVPLWRRIAITIGWVVLLAIILLAIFALIPYREIKTESMGDIIVHSAKAENVVTLAEKIVELKKRVIMSLESCESGTASEPDALIIFDSNKVARLGRLQFQKKTIQHYMQLFYGKKITKLEAIEIAHTKEKAESLAEQIIFGEQGGIWNWKNCAGKLNLAAKVEFIKELSK